MVETGASETIAAVMTVVTVEHIAVPIAVAREQAVIRVNSNVVTLIKHLPRETKMGNIVTALCINHTLTVAHLLTMFHVEGVMYISRLVDILTSTVFA